MRSRSSSAPWSTSSGAIRHTQVSYSPDVVDGEVVGLFVMITDVTPRVEAQRQMDEAQRLAELGSWTLIPATGELTWSRQLFELVGQDPDTFTPAVDALVPQLHPEDRERVLATSTQAREVGHRVRAALPAGPHRRRGARDAQPGARRGRRPTVR